MSPTPTWAVQRRRLGPRRQQIRNRLLHLGQARRDGRQVGRQPGHHRRFPGPLRGMLLVAHGRAPRDQIVPIADQGTQPRQVWLIRRGPAQLRLMQRGEAGQQLRIGAIGLVATQPAGAEGGHLRGIDDGDRQLREQQAARRGRW